MTPATYGGGMTYNGETIYTDQPPYTTSGAYMEQPPPSFQGDRNDRVGTNTFTATYKSAPLAGNYTHQSGELLPIPPTSAHGPPVPLSSQPRIVPQEEIRSSYTMPQRSVPAYSEYARPTAEPMPQIHDRMQPSDQDLQAIKMISERLFNDMREEFQRQLKVIEMRFEDYNQQIQAVGVMAQNQTDISARHSTIEELSRNMQSRIARLESQVMDMQEGRGKQPRGLGGSNSLEDWMSRTESRLDDLTGERKQKYMQVKLVSAKKLPSKDMFGGKSDPYAVCEVVGKPHSKFQTRVLNNETDPIWEHTGELSDYLPGDSLEITVFDKDVWPKRDDPVGKVIIPSKTFYPDGFAGTIALNPDSDSSEATIDVEIVPAMEGASPGLAGAAVLARSASTIAREAQDTVQAEKRKQEELDRRLAEVDKAVKFQQEAMFDMQHSIQEVHELYRRFEEREELLNKKEQEELEKLAKAQEKTDKVDHDQGTRINILEAGVKELQSHQSEHAVIKSEYAEAISKIDQIKEQFSKKLLEAWNTERKARKDLAVDVQRQLNKPIKQANEDSNGGSWMGNMFG